MFISSPKYYLSSLINFVVFYFFTALIIIPKAYGAGIILSIIALILIIYYLVKDRRQLILNDNSYLYFITFFIYFTIFLLDIIIHEDSIKILDDPSRCLFFSLIFFLLKSYPVKLKIILYAIPLGSIAAGVMASYQIFILGYPRALHSTFQMAIQHGDMAMSLGMFCFAILFFSWKKKNLILCYLCFFGTLCGIIGSLLSGSRGGWLLAPFIVVTLIYLNRHIISKKIIIFFAGIFILSTTALIIVQPTLLSRIEVAYQQIKNINSQNKEDDGSVTPRLELWKAGILAIQEKPIFGWGNEGSKKHRLEQGKQGILPEHTANSGHAHNQYINDTLERGVIGLFALLGIFLLPLWQYFKAYRQNRDHLEIKLLATLGIIHITSVMSYGLTQVFFAHNSGNMFYFFLTVLFYAMILNYKA